MQVSQHLGDGRDLGLIVVAEEGVGPRFHNLFPQFQQRKKPANSGRSCPEESVKLLAFRVQGIKQDIFAVTHDRMVSLDLSVERGTGLAIQLAETIRRDNPVDFIMPVIDDWLPAPNLAHVEHENERVQAEALFHQDIFPAVGLG